MSAKKKAEETFTPSPGTVQQQNSAPEGRPSATEKWTEITLLPEWEEEYYLVYTAKKYGRWVMLKTLKPEYAELPEFKQMLEKEFDVRYNLEHR